MNNLAIINSPFLKDKDGDDSGIISLIELTITTVDNGYIVKYVYEDETELFEVYQDALEMFSVLKDQYLLDNYIFLKKTPLK